MSLRPAAALLFAASASSAMAQEPAPDLALYECVQNEGQAGRADDLVAGGFEVVSVGRFEGLILTLAHPLTGARASCQLRQEPSK